MCIRDSNRAVRGRYESRSNTLAPLVAVGGVLQQNVMSAALDNGGGGDQRQLGLLTQLRDRQRLSLIHILSRYREEFSHLQSRLFCVFVLQVE